MLLIFRNGPWVPASGQLTRGSLAGLAREGASCPPGGRLAAVPGALMATRGLDADQAFQVLARESQNTNTKLREIAVLVLENLRREQDGRQPGR